MDRNEAIELLSSEKPLFSEVLEFDLEERNDLIVKHKNELNYICDLVNQYIKDVTHVLKNRMPISMISNLTYNLVHNLVSCYVGLTIYDYLQTAYLIDEDYDVNYEMWKNFSQCARKIEKMISNLNDANVFNIDEPSACENLQPLASTEKRVPLSLLNLQHTLSKMNGESLFIALLDNIRGIESRLNTIKMGINNLTDEDFETIYNSNYALYVEAYWPCDGKDFRHHIEEHYFNHRESKIDTLSKLLRDEKFDFGKTQTGTLWRDYFHDKKTLYFEMRKAKIDEKQWKFFFNGICRFEEYEKWIHELEHPQISSNEYPESDWDKIFKDVLDLNKVKQILSSLLNGDFSITNCFIAHKVLEEIDYLQDEMDTHFISWIDSIYGWEFKTRNFKSVNPGFKNVHSLDWTTRTITSAKIAKDYIDLAKKIRNVFVLEMDGKNVIRDNKYYFKKDNLYIKHKDWSK